MKDSKVPLFSPLVNHLTITLATNLHVTVNPEPRSEGPDKHWWELLSLTIDMCLFSAWKLFVSRGQSQDHVKVLSQTTASFSVRLCAKSNGSTVCQATETHTMHVVGATHMLQWCNGGGVNFPLGTCVHGKELPLHACTDCIVDCVHLFFVVAGDETCFHAVRCNHFQNFLVLCKKLTVTYNFTSGFSFSIWTSLIFFNLSSICQPFTIYTFTKYIFIRNYASLEFSQSTQICISCIIIKRLQKTASFQQLTDHVSNRKWRGVRKQILYSKCVVEKAVY